MPMIIDRTHPANGATAFAIEDRPKIIFTQDVDEDSINRATISLVNRDNGRSIPIDYRITGPEVLILPALTLDEETGYKIIIAGVDLGNPAGHVKAANGDDFNVTQTLLFVTKTREASLLVDVDTTKECIESVYIEGPTPHDPILVETLKLKLLESNPQCGEIGINPEYINEKGIRLTFNRPVDYDSAVKYINMSHMPISGIRAMAGDVDSIECSYKDGGYENFCFDNRNDKLNPLFNIWIQGNDVLLTYIGSPADIEAGNLVPPLVSSSSSGYPDYTPVIPSSSSEGDYTFVVYGELTEETNSFNFGRHERAWLTMESHLIKDRYRVEQDGNIIYDSGCISTDGVKLTVDFAISPLTPFYVTVIGGCDPAETIQGTAWSFQISSKDPNALPSSSSSGVPSSSSSGAPSSSSSSGALSSSSSAAPSSSSSAAPSSSSSSALPSSSSSGEVSSSSACNFGTNSAVLNAEIRIEIDGNLTSQGDSNNVTTTLEDHEMIFFLTGLFPLYSDIELVRLELDNLNSRHTDEHLLRLILKNSLKAWTLSCCSFDLCNPPPEAIAYVEYKTQLDVFDMTFTGSSTDRGVSRHLGDFSIRTASRASNAKRTPIENEISDLALALAKNLRYNCPGTKGIAWAVKGSLNPTTKPNYRTRTYNWIPTEYSWTSPSLNGLSRYIELPKLGDRYS